MPRKSSEQQIELLEAKIRAIREKAERRKVLKNPAVKPMSAALRYIDKALNASEDGALRKALDEARATVASCLALCGVTARSAKKTRGRATRASSAELDSDKVLGYLRNNPGQRSEDITSALNTDAVALRSAMRTLVEAGQVRTEGQKRGTRYFSSEKRGR